MVKWSVLPDTSLWDASISASIIMQQYELNYLIPLFSPRYSNRQFQLVCLFITAAHARFTFTLSYTSHFNMRWPLVEKGHVWKDCDKQAQKISFKSIYFWKMLVAWLYIRVLSTFKIQWRFPENHIAPTIFVSYCYTRNCSVRFMPLYMTIHKVTATILCKQCIFA